LQTGSRYLLVLLLVFLSLTGTVILSLEFPGAPAARQAAVSRQAVELTGLPDLALGHAAVWIRHRSLATPFAVFPDDGTLLDYLPGSFVYQLQLPQTQAGFHEP
jgi:hypothetical protein